MLIGVPKEIKDSEFRVGIIPAAVKEFTVRGHTVLVETNAGTGIGFSDNDYQAAGAEIRTNAASVYAESEIIVKVKEPQAVEHRYLHKNHVLFTYLHLAADRE